MRRTIYGGGKSVLSAVILLIMLLASGSVQAKPSFQNENLRYVISYKWGLIHKDAGDATLSLRRSGSHYNVMLAAKTKPWADRFYRVRDTLTATIRTSDLLPTQYTKITHEKNMNDRDEIRYSRSGGKTTGYCKVYKTREGKTKVKEITLHATGPVYDMLSIFYYLRKLDYAALDRTKIYKATVFSGTKSENIKIRSLGKEMIKLKDKTEREAYHIRFNFTQEGGKKSSDDIDTWISTDSDHIPLYLVGKLPVGEVRAYFLGK